MSPDKQKLMEDIHSSYHRLFGLAESMEMIPGVSLPMIDEAKQALIHMAGCLEDALAVSEEPRRRMLPGSSVSLAVSEEKPFLLNPKTVTGEELRRAAQWMQTRITP